MNRASPYIVIDGRMILPHMTGAGRYLLGLCRGLNAIPGDERIELWVQEGLPADHPVWRLNSDRVHVRPIPAAHLSLRSQWVLPGMLLRARPDLFHCPHFDLPWLTPGRVVATLHDLKYLIHPDFFPRTGSLRRLVIRAMMRHTLSRAAQVITPSQSTANDLIRYLNAPAEKLRVIPLGVDESHFAMAKPESLAATRRRYGLEQPFILFVGERRPHKNLEGLLRAFDLFHRKISPAHLLVIVGKPYSDYAQPETLVKALGLEKCVRFFEDLPDSDLPSIYHAADAFILLSRYEGFGLPVIEAMACGTPVVVSNVTSLPEVAGEAGLQVSPDNPEQAAEALGRIITGGRERQQRIALGIAHARRFTWESCARQTLDVYAQSITR
jgi:glycosyltransferase involved in cell wall biosynthesis